MSDLVAWPDAAAIAGRLAAPGPVVSRREAEELVASLRRAAGRAVAPVVTITEMLPADGGDLQLLSGVRVVDRAGWAQASARTMQTMTAGALRRPAGRPVPLAAELTSSAEVGAMLAFLSGKILGQFDPYADASANLLLVAPNVLAAERAMKVSPEDFRLWVCLHEQTHALQFAAAPWLAGHLLSRTRDLVDGLGAGPAVPSTPWQATSTVLTFVKAVYAAVRGHGGPTLMDGLLTEQQRHALEETTAIMSLLEGHADVAMDAVGSSVVPSVRAIRKKFTARRQTSTSAERVIGRLLGMDAKMAQYRDGAAFVRAVTAKVGTLGLNAVWTSAETLPQPREISDPVAWVRRVHG